MRKVVAAIVDKGSVFEMKAGYGRAVVTALARLDGHPVGLIANNPRIKGGALDAAACNKATGFMVLCDSFNVPLVLLVDVPGFLVGLEGERVGVPGRIINWMNALALCTVPKISVILRKSYGQAYLNMGGGRNSHEMAVWPTADLGFMDPHVGVNIIYGITEEDDPEAFKQRVEELSRDSEPWDLAALYEAQEVIDPRETRAWVARMLDVHRCRLTGGIGDHLMASWPTSYV
jgi:acetyl-CoA carboxylase carboxyltransferase component